VACYALLVRMTIVPAVVALAGKHDHGAQRR
jgi:hypothetical protein